MSRTVKQSPEEILMSFCSWGAGGATSEATTAFVRTAHADLGLETCMHLTCTNMPVDMVNAALKVSHTCTLSSIDRTTDRRSLRLHRRIIQEAYDSGCQNILALRGDPPRGSEEWVATEGGFNHAIDLIRHIRNLYGDYFDIGVSQAFRVSRE